MWMNEYEIDHAAEMIDNRAPEFSKYAKYLSDWRTVVNENSDGWPYWKVGGRAAEGLMGLVQRVTNVIAGRGGEMPTEAEFRKAISKIKSAATKHGLNAPVLDDVPSASNAP